MALFEGTVAFVMISASMKSMDPALEESARVMGASKLRTTLTVTLPLVMPGVLGATLFVFAEMLGSFAAALVIAIVLAALPLAMLVRPPVRIAERKPLAITSGIALVASLGLLIGEHAYTDRLWPATWGGAEWKIERYPGIKTAPRAH